MSIAPLLLAVSGVLQVPSPGEELVVRVVDADGKPCPGVQVATGSRHKGSPASEMYHDLQVTDAAEGRVRFHSLSGYLMPMPGQQYFVRLGVPADPPVEARVKPKRLDEELTLVLPDCGSVVVRVPANAKGSAQLRIAPAEGSRPFWRSRQPPKAEIVDGVARFEHVGLGVELEYEIASEDLPVGLHGRFAGPTRKGEVVEVAVGDLEGGPAVVATLVDAQLAPVGGLEIDWALIVHAGGTSWSNGRSALTDEHGRVRIPLKGLLDEPGERRITFYSWTNEAAKERVGKAYACAHLPADFASGELDLGELILATFGSPARFRRLDDAAMKRAYEGPAGELSGPTRDAGDPREEMLSEMIRRGGPGWEMYVASQLAALRASHEDFVRPGELELLTALRRLQHLPDPLALIVRHDSILDVQYPEAPVVLFDWRNVDERGEPFEITDGGSYRSGRFARCSVEVVGPDGRAVPRLAPPASFGGGVFTTRRLRSGRSLEGGIDLGDYVAFEVPGEYRVRLHYHDKEDIDQLADLAGWIVSSSDEFVVRVQALPIEITRARLAQTSEWIRAIDATKTIPLVSGTWHPDMSFRGAPSSPEDELFRAGWEAVPALFEALEADDIEPERRAWVLGMLWNILGLENPLTDDHRRALGKASWVGAWPTSTEEAPFAFGEFGTFSPTEIDPADQDELVRAWLRREPLFAVTIVP